MMNEENKTDQAEAPKNFIHEIIENDLQTNKFEGRVQTRFPPEPNGYLHIGHAKSICLNFGIAQKYNGKCNLRFDDTNPSKEDQEYVDSIMEDIKWLGFNWGGKEFYASDYFDTLYEYAVKLIKKGKAYVDDHSADEISKMRGTPTRPGQESNFRSRTPEENLMLFEKMKNGDFDEGTKVLRVKIDMSSPNMQMRDPVMYRIKKATHHRTGNKWCIYPMYDWAHGQSDSLEKITHSICTLEFENHKPLYNWFLDELEIYHPVQIEFARLNLNYTIMSKRKLLQLVEEKYVSGWDDPRMPTISGLRRRGYTPESIRNFAERVGIAKRENIIDVGLLEHSIREDLNKRANRYMAVLNPLKVVIINYPDNSTEEMDAVNNPENPDAGTRKIPFSKTLYIEKDDFMENPPKKFFRLSPGNEVRLRYAYIIKCEEVIKDSSGNILELRCSYDPETKSGSGNSDKKVKGTIHWVSAEHSVNAEVRLYDRLFNVENPDETQEGQTFTDHLNPDSLKVLKNCKIEPALSKAIKTEKIQFERLGYFCFDSKDSSISNIVFNRTVTLKDSWSKLQK